MSGRLRLDTGELQERANALRVLATEFDIADDVAGALEEAVGVHRDTGWLRDEIGGFASSWRIRREKMQTSISELEGFVQQAVTAFEGAEADLAAGINGSQSASALDGVDGSGGTYV